MDTSQLPSTIKSLLRKYGLCTLVLLAGILLMLLPGSPPAAEPEVALPTTAQEDSFETRLSRILSQMDGAGEVQVFLSLRSGAQTLYQSNESQSSDDFRQETVIITGSDRAQTGLVQRVDPPIYQGAVVLCQGAKDAAVRLAITQAVANATGLGTNQITVLKMK